MISTSTLDKSRQWWNVRYVMLMVVEASAWAVVWKNHDTYIKLFYNRLPVWTPIWNIQTGKRGRPRVVHLFKFHFSQTRRGSGTAQWRLHCITVQRALPSRVRIWSFQLHTTWWTHGTKMATRPFTWRSLRETSPSSSSYCQKMQTSTALTMKDIPWSTGLLVSWCSVLPPSGHMQILKWRARFFFFFYWGFHFKFLHKLLIWYLSRLSNFST